MEPVEIDFLIGGNVESEGGKVVRSLDDITQAGKRSIAEAKKAVAEKKSVIRKLESDLKRLEKKLDATSDTKSVKELGQRILEAQEALYKEKIALDECEKKANDLANSHKQLRVQITEAKDALGKLEMQGKRGSAEWNAVAERLGVLNDQMGDTAMQAKILADDQKGFRAVASAASGMAGAMSAAVGAASLLGAKNEDLIKIQTRLQSIMAITIGLQQVAETLNKDSYFSVVLLTKAKNAWAAANSRLAASLWGSTVAAKALNATGVGLLITGIAVLVAAVGKVISKNKEQKKAAEEAAKAQREAAQRTADDFGKERAKIEAMRAALDSETVSRKQKLSIINKLKEQIPGYTAELNREGEVIRENKKALDEYISSIDKSLKLRAAEKELEGIYSKIYDIEKRLPKKEQPSDNKFIIPAEKTLGDKMLEALTQTLEKDLEKLKGEADKIKKYISENGLIDTIAGAKGGGDTAKTEKQEYNAEKAIVEKLAGLRQQTARLEIEQMEDGLQKRLAQIDNEGRVELAKVAETQQKIVEEYNKANKDKKGFSPAKSIADIDPKAAAEFEAETLKIKTNTDKLRKKATEEHQKNILAIARKYADERVQIEYDYNEDIKKLEAAGQTEAATATRAKRDKAISDTTAEMIRETEIYRLAMDDRLNVSAEVTEKLIADIRRRVEAEMAAGKLTAKRGKKILDEITKVGVSREFGKNPFKDLLNGLKQYKKAKDELNKSKDSATPEALAKMENAANEMLEKTAAAAAASLDGVRDILGSVTDAMSEFGLLNEQQKKDAEDIIGMVGGAADIAAGIASGNPVQIIQGAVSFIAKAASFFDFKGKRIRKEQNQVIEQVNELSRAYTRLSREVEKALGTDVFARQRAQIENLKKQVSDYWRLIDLENKKRAKKRDQNAIAEWKQAIDDAKAQMEDIIGAIREQLTGTTTKSMVGDLGNALVSALQEGEDAALKFGSVFDDVIRNAVLNAFKLKYLEKPVDDWLNDLGRYMDDGELQSWEKKALEGRRDAIFQSSKAGFDAISELFKTDGMGAQAQGIKGDVRNMSEDTGTALVGAINGMRINVDAMLKRMQTFAELMDKFSRNLEKIEENTAFCKKLKDIDETLTDLKNNGIKLK